MILRLATPITIVVNIPVSARISAEPLVQEVNPLLAGINEYLFGIALNGMQLEPSGCSAEGTVTGKIRNRRQVTALNIRRFLHPMRIVLNVLSDLRPTACEVSCLG